MDGCASALAENLWQETLTASQLCTVSQDDAQGAKRSASWGEGHKKASIQLFT